MLLRVDIETILSDLGIEFVTSGPNVRAGEVAIKCPFCSDDPSHHLNINPQTGAFRCWRDYAHRGGKPHHLIMRLAGCSWDEARRLLGESGERVPDGFDGVKERLLDKPPEQEPPHKIRMPKSFRMIDNEGFGKRFWHYLVRRGFNEDKALSTLVRIFDLRYTMTGEHKCRIIIPVYYCKLLGWTSRAITKHAQLRYLTYPEGSGGIRDSLLGANLAHPGGEHLVITEGPMDAMKLTLYGSKQGVFGVALFGKSATPRQAVLIAELAERFKHVSIMLDTDAYADCIKLADALSFIKPSPRAVPVPAGRKDPGGLTKAEVFQFCQSLPV